MRIKTNQIRRGLCRIDIPVTIVCITFLCAIGSAVLGQEPTTRSDTTRSHPRSIKDAVQLKQIHAVWVIFARDYCGHFPTPGLIDRGGIVAPGSPRDGQQQPGRGPEDLTANTTANLYSALVMQNYFTPQLIISPVERNPNVKVKHDYDWSAYDPIGDVYLGLEVQG